MKKFLAILTVISLLFALSACNIKDVTKMATVGEEAAEKGVFNFYLQQGINAAMQASGGAIAADATEEVWETVKIGEISAKEYAIEEAKDAVKTAFVMKALAIKEGITLTEEDKAGMLEQKTALIEQYGGRYNYEQYFTQGGFTLEDIDKIIEAETYAQKVMAKYFGEGAEDGEVTVSDEDVKKVLADEYVMAKHILIKNEVPAVAEGEKAMTAEEADKAAKEKAAELIKALDGGANFDALMKENSEDKNAETGEINGADGYFFTKGMMVPEFEAEAFALEVGKYSKEPVGTDYGYHVLLKLANPTSGEDYDSAFENAKATLLQGKLDGMVDKWAEELGFKFNDKAISKVKIVK